MKPVTKVFEDSLKAWTDFCAYYREYPDLFIDLISPPRPKVRLYFYQRMLLRIIFRYQNTYITMTRGTAKSYTQILALYLKCIMYPNIKVFLCAPTAKQAANITKANVENIWSHFPLLKHEIAKEEFQKDYTRLIFKNGSQLEVVQVAQSSRGTRAHGGAIEEIVDDHMKKEELNEVVLPMMADDRKVSSYGTDKNENRKSLTIVTTCGTRQSFAYEKLVEVAREMAEGKSSFIIGSGYELPVMHDQLDIDFINGLKNKETYSTASFDREYQSIWSGSSDSSLLSLDDINEARILSTPEFKNTDSEASYILSYDVARAEGSANANSALIVYKCKPRNDGTYSKHIVNIFSNQGMHFLEQAKFLKKKMVEFKGEILIVDGNGAGSGLIDFLTTEIDDNPPYSVVNDSRYDASKLPDSKPLLFLMNSSKAETRASKIHDVFVNGIQKKDVKMLVSESQATVEKRSKNVDKERESMIPHIMTDIMIEEFMNLEYKASGNETKVVQISKSIPKDKFSAAEYGYYYIYLMEQKNKKRKEQTFNINDWNMIKSPKRYR